MASDIERRSFARQADSIFERVAVCHQGGRRQHAMNVRVDDSRIHVACEAEIVGINNQPFQAKKYAA